MIWDACEGATHLQTVSGTAWRLVESQEQIATLGYVDTLEEQALLEELLDSVKPPYPANSDSYHYLLKTPFRYPPLRWGSRFGRIHEPGIFYAGCDTQTTLAESAFYRFVFWHSIDSKPIKNTITSAHTLFCVNYQSQRGMKLQAAPFDQFLPQLTHPQDYSASQQLGSDMRAARVEAFEYQSARAQQQGCCVGLFVTAALAQKKPTNMAQWLCELGATEVAFKQLGQKEIIRFPLDNFLIDGRLPMPAA
ncbi:MAG TPA: RES family NAD+ phosphorylase [Cellvibrio sp.]|nr:RES family NAD+ phosphorylase [Cellvibrio sp.]